MVIQCVDINKFKAERIKLVPKVDEPKVRHFVGMKLLSAEITDSSTSEPLEVEGKEMLETIRIAACRFIMLIEIERKPEKTSKGKSIRERLREKN